MPKIRPEKVSLKASQIENIAPSIFRFSFEATREVNFQPGQILNVFIKPGVTRSYSIASIPHEDIELVVDISPGGEGSKFFQNLKVGDKVEVLLPLGKFVLDNVKSAKLVFIATGTGIAPLRSMIRSLLPCTHKKLKINLFWGLRTMKDIYFFDEINEYKSSFPSFDFVYCLSREAEQLPSTGFFKGRVTALIPKYSFEPETHFYLCGSNEMIFEIKNTLYEQGFNDNNIHYEQFY